MSDVALVLVVALPALLGWDGWRRYLNRQRADTAALVAKHDTALVVLDGQLERIDGDLGDLRRVAQNAAMTQVGGRPRLRK